MTGWLKGEDHKLNPFLTASIQSEVPVEDAFGCHLPSEPLAEGGGQAGSWLKAEEHKAAGWAHKEGAKLKQWKHRETALLRAAKRDLRPREVLRTPCDYLQSSKPLVRI